MKNRGIFIFLYKSAFGQKAMVFLKQQDKLKIGLPPVRNSK